MQRFCPHGPKEPCGVKINRKEAQGWNIRGIRPLLLCHPTTAIACSGRRCGRRRRGSRILGRLLSCKFKGVHEAVLPKRAVGLSHTKSVPQQRVVGAVAECPLERSAGFDGAVSPVWSSAGKICSTCPRCSSTRLTRRGALSCKLPMTKPGQLNLCFAREGA